MAPPTVSLAPSDMSAAERGQADQSLDDAGEIAAAGSASTAAINGR